MRSLKLNLLNISNITIKITDCHILRIKFPNSMYRCKYRFQYGAFIYNNYLSLTFT